jgi:drug/metabolite transporter (DMT)-like permease
MIGLCAIWGLQQVAIKSTNATLPPVFQAGVRSAIAAVLVWGWARSRGTPLFRDDGTLGAGLLAGVLFAGEFVCIFLGLTLTSASRMAVFLYTAPCFTALGLHWFVDGERMRRIQWLGIVVAFAGMTLATPRAVRWSRELWATRSVCWPASRGPRPPWWCAPRASLNRAPARRCSIN